MKESKVYVDVVLPLPVKGFFTYFYAESLPVGQRVIVQFGARKIYSAIVCKVHGHSPTDYKAKEILGVIDEPPVVNKKQLEFWQWIAEYYMCNIGDVMNAALPS